jgi:CII-binding regulator of phage lambda lysogenization HflD
MRAKQNTTIGILAGLLLGLIAALSLEQFALDQVQRAGLAKWLWDWQQLLSGLLALLAAGLTAVLLWQQLTDTRRQAIAAEKQALFTTVDALSRYLATANNLRSESLSGNIKRDYKVFGA